MIHLSTVPTFGYEYATCNADKARINSYAKLELPNPKEAAETNHIAANIFKVLGTIMPLVGFVRIAMALCDEDIPADSFLREVLRGIAEILGAGALLLLADITVTIAREVLKDSQPVAVPASA
jgi:hypothetical protein